MRINTNIYLRQPAGQGTYRYEPLTQHIPTGTHAYLIPSPPAVGDHIALPKAGIVRVVERQWAYPGYGSQAWPSGQAQPSDVQLDLIVEATTGVFRDEAPTNGDGEYV